MYERFTDRARRVIVLAQEAARNAGSTYIGTEHLLLGLVKQGDGGTNTATRLLNELDGAHESVRRTVVQLLGGSDARTTAPLAPLTSLPGTSNEEPELLQRVLNAVVRASDTQLHAVLCMLQEK